MQVTKDEILGKLNTGSQESRDAMTAALAAKDTTVIAALVSVGRTRPKATELGDGTIIAAIGDLTAGNAFLDIVKSPASDSPYRHIKDVIARGAFDISQPLAMYGVQSMVTLGVLTQAQATALISLGKQPDPVSEYEARCVLYDASGNWLGG